MTAPNATERRLCWAARDALWKCLDDHGDKAAACETLQKEFEATCPDQWVKYFAKRRDFLKYKAKLVGFEPADGTAKS